MHKSTYYVTLLQGHAYNEIERKKVVISMCEFDCLQTMDVSTDDGLKAELRNMLLTADKSTHNISKYKADYGKLDTVWKQLIEDEYLVEYSAYGVIRPSTTKEGNYIKSFQIIGIDDDYFNRLEKV